MDVTAARRLGGSLVHTALALTQRRKLQRVNLLDALVNPTQTLTCTAHLNLAYATNISGDTASENTYRVL